MSSEGNLKTYRGNCHCGAFIYEAKLPEITSYSECNCSICRKKGYAYLLPEGGQIDVVKGSIDDLASYAFNKGGFVHLFCPNCGTAVLAQKLGDASAVKTIINVSRHDEIGNDLRGGLCLLVRRREPSRISTCGPSMSSRELRPMPAVCLSSLWLTGLEGSTARHWALPTSPPTIKAPSLLSTKAAKYVRAVIPNASASLSRELMPN